MRVNQRLFFFVFFFSSRRRHTRYWRDWSSDVCSSDLMQSVPKDMYESAMLDGASRWRVFRSITVPSIRPTILFTVIVSTIGGMQLFVEPQLFDPGGTATGTGGDDRQFQTVVMYLRSEEHTSELQ